MAKSWIAVVLCLLVACNLLVDEVASVCCKPVKGCYPTMYGAVCRLCADGTEGTPFCAYHGECNSSGCDCETRCRELPEWMETMDFSRASSNIDSDRDGHVSEREERGFIYSTGKLLNGAPATEQDLERITAQFFKSLPNKSAFSPVYKGRSSTFYSSLSNRN